MAHHESEKPPSQSSEDGTAIQGNASSDGPSSDGPSSKQSNTGLKSYFVCYPICSCYFGSPPQRVFSYADRKSWILNIVAFLAAIGAGAVLPLMDLIFGKFVTAFVNFATGVSTAADYRAQVNKYTCEHLNIQAFK